MTTTTTAPPATEPSATSAVASAAAGTTTVAASPRRRLSGVVRAEAIRLRRPTFVGAGAALLVGFTLLGSAMAFLADGATPFAEALDLTAADGVVAGVRGAVAIIGVVVLSLWATATAGDYASGLVRLQVQAEPRRWRLLAGKVLALAGATLVGTVLVVAVGVGSAYAFAAVADVSTAAWGSGLLGTVVGAWVDVSIAALGYGLMGLALATLSRSSTIAVSAGVGYLFIVEGMLSRLFGLDTGFLPGGALSAVAEGGTAETTWIAGLVTALLWVGSMTVAGVLTFTRRDVVD